jgi:hypothetical protein
MFCRNFLVNRVGDSRLDPVCRRQSDFQDVRQYRLPMLIEFTVDEYADATFTAKGRLPYVYQSANYPSQISK